MRLVKMVGKKRKRILEMGGPGILWEAYLRWRHSKGYGVHSPFAYRLVCDVVSPGQYGYYGYHDIYRACARYGQGKFSEENLRLMLRLAVALKAHRLWVYPELTPSLKAVGKGAGIKMRQLSAGMMPKPEEGDLCLIHGAYPNIEDILGEGASVIIFDSNAVGAMPEITMKRGLVFSGKRIIIAIPRQEMAFVKYSMRF